MTEKVTVQDVLDGGGELEIGDPVMAPNGHRMYLVGMNEGGIDGKYWCRSVEEDDRFKPDELTFYADGIRILDIDGRLYRVTGHTGGQPGFPYSPRFATIEPLIPDKPKPGVCDESIKAAYDERRFGRFRIYRGQLRDTPHRVLEFFLRLKMLILKAEYLPELDGLEYTIVHPSFAPVPQGRIAPLYMLAYSAESIGGGRTEEKIIGWDVTDERTK